ncbi:OmpA family protein [Azohydromonas australica]|uniref:OmpA family protein n=1 Tax=Azohydromonas australica TaxID=364039 RepID=UPI0006840D5F|nr:OmpA family protein [Azohydromonas australica]
MLDAAGKIQRATADLVAAARASAAERLAAEDAVPMRPAALRPARGGLSAAAAGGNVVYTYRFPLGSTKLELPPAAAAQLVAAARQAQLVVLRGRTDSARDDVANARAAQRRAEAAQLLLIKGGVPMDRMRLTYQGAGDFVAPNTTPDGRAFNRRVEIELYPVRPQAIEPPEPPAVIAAQ